MDAAHPPLPDANGMLPVPAAVAAQDGGDVALSEALEPLSAALAEVARGLDARFVAAGTALAQAYEVVETLVSALERVTGAMEEAGAAAAIATMRATADRLIRLPTLQAERGVALSEVLQISVVLREDIDQVHRTLSFLRICGLNIKVAAAGMGEFGTFADNMITKLDVAETEMAGIVAEIDVLAQNVPDVFRVERQLAAECAAVVPDVPNRLAADALALQQHQAGLAEQATKVASVARDVRARVATALGALQIGDITRQRIEHVVEGVQAVEAIGAAHPELDGASVAAIRSQVIAMLAAQMADATKDFQRETALLMQSLHGIAPHAAALLAFGRSGDADAPGSRGNREAVFLAELEKSVAEAESVTGRLRVADAQSQQLGNATSATAEDLGVRLRNVHRVKNDVQQMAWNTDLRCYRMGDDGRGLAVVASEIRGFAITLGDISGRIGGSFDRLTAAAAALRGPQDGADAAQSLGDSLWRIRDGGQRMREGLAGLENDASAIADVLREATTQVDCDAVGAMLATQAEQLAGFGMNGAAVSDEAMPVLLAIFDEILRRYTMAAEREIHRQFVPGTGEVSEAAASVDADDDDFDDGLF